MIVALMARFSYVVHLARFHEVEWKHDSKDGCPGDILCHTCQLVLWCRMLDPWNTHELD